MKEKKYSKSIWDSIKFTYSTDKTLMISYVFLKLSTTAGVFVNLYFVKLIINAFLVGKTKREILILSLYCLISNFVLFLIKRFSFETVVAHESICVYKKDMAINKKTMRLDYELLENQEIHTNLVKTKQYERFGYYGLSHIAHYFSDILNAVIVFILAIIVSVDLFLKPVDIIPIANWIQNSVFVVLFLGLNLISVYKLKKFNKSMENLLTGDIMFNNTLADACFQCFENYKIGKDIRLYNYNIMQDVLNKMTSSAKQIYGLMIGNQMKTNIPTALIEFLSLLLVYLYTGIKAYGGGIQIGEVVQYTGMIAQAAMAIPTVINAVSSLFANKEYFNIVFDYLNLKNQKYEGTLPVEKRNDNEYEFEFKDVSFKYPNTEKFVLENVNLKFNVGKKVAIVGKNGSGKTTLIKLLTRLYEPTKGEILLNGINIKKYDYDEYLDIFSVVFQDFKLFSFKLGQNISTDLNYDSEKANAVLSKCGFDHSLAKMPKKLEANLYQDYEEDGVEISGGEAQKIALARALYKDTPFIILDEPTAALDPISEFEIYSKFDEIVEEKTAVYISHRLSSCRFCDEIVVFDEGKIVQHGNHQKLLADESGVYSKLWNAQAQYYT